MFEEEDGQNGTQSNDQSGSRGPYGIARPSALDDNSMADQISSGKMFATPQPGNTSGDFVNRGLALRVDPVTGIAYRTLIGAAAQTAPGQNGPNGQNTDGQTAAGQNPAYVLPIQTRDAQGKTLPKYRMGVGQRILATVANFANGFAGNGASPIYAGPGALNNRYYQDEVIRQQQNAESPTLQGSGDRYRQTIDWRTIVQDPVSKKWYGKTYGGQKQEIGTPPWAGTEGDGDTNNDDDGSGPPPIGTQVGTGPETTSRERFAKIRKSKAYR